MVAALGCISERSRPAPPLLRVTFNRPQVTSPGSFTGTVRAEDRDGLDSIWISLESERFGEDGFFLQVVLAPFAFTVPNGFPPGAVLAVRVEARDVTGFRSAIDTSVTVAP